MAYNNLYKGFTGASFIVTEACNLRCTYCFENCKIRSKESMSKEVIDAGMRMLFDNAIAEQQENERQISNIYSDNTIEPQKKDQIIRDLRNRRSNVNIILFGGEPTLHIDKCDYIMEAGADLSSRYNIPFSANIITNTTLFNDKIEQFLIKWRDDRRVNFTVQLSIDGVKKVQDEYRVYENGKGSYDVVMKNLPKYRAIMGRMCTVHGCVNKNSLPYLYDNYMLFERTYPEAFKWWMPVHTEKWDAEDVKLYESELEKIFHYMITFKKFNFSPIDKLTSHGTFDCHPGHMCGAGTTFCSFTPEGDIYPCHNIYFTDPTHSEKIGTVFTGVTAPEKLKKYAETNAVTMGCGQCPNTKCYRCIADNFNYNKDINKQVGKPYRCAMSAVERKLQKKCRDAQLVIDLMINYERLINLLDILLKDYDKEMLDYRKDPAEGWFSNSNTSLDFIKTLKEDAEKILNELRRPFNEAEAKWNDMVKENPYVDPNYMVEEDDRSNRNLQKDEVEPTRCECNMMEAHLSECNEDCDGCDECKKKCSDNISSATISDIPSATVEEVAKEDIKRLNLVMDKTIDKLQTLEEVVSKLSQIIIMNHDNSMINNK